VRHVISAELLDVSVVSNPAYADATCALRSFAAQHGVDPDELLANVAAGNVDLRGYYTRTDLAVAATPMVEPAVSHRIPTPDEVRASYGIEARAETGEAEIQRKLLAHIMKKHAWNAPHQASGADVLDLARRRHALNENGEQRSSAVATVESRTARGHLIAIGESDVHDYGRW